MFRRVKHFASDEDGAVTIDWVVLTGAIVGLGIAVIASVQTATTDVSTGIGARIDQQSTQLLPGGG